MQQRLYQLLLRTFEKDELRVCLRAYDPEIDYHVPWDGAYAPIIHELLELLRRTGALRDPRLYINLAAARPDIRDDLTHAAAEHDLRDLEWPAASPTDNSVVPTPGLHTIPQHDEPFVGRAEQLRRIAAHFADETSPTALVLTGPAGVGKSALACHYARVGRELFLHRLYVRFSQRGPPSALAAVGLSLLGLPIASLPLEAQCDATLYCLSARRCLLVYDDIADPEQLRRWLPPDRSRCRVLATSTSSDWPERWRRLDISPLSQVAATELIHALVSGHHPRTRKQISEEFAPGLILQAAGLPVQLVPETSALAKKLDDDPDATHEPTLTTAAARAFKGPWSALSEPARRVLRIAAVFAAHYIPPERLRELCTLAGEDPAVVPHALDECRLLRLLERPANTPDLRMHPLVRTFVIQRADVSAAVMTTAAQWLVAASVEVRDAPSDHDRIRTFRSFPLDRASWPVLFPHAEEPPGPLLVSEALSQLGEHVPARDWVKSTLTADTPLGIPLGRRLLRLAQCEYDLLRLEEAVTIARRAVREFRNPNEDVERHSFLYRALHWTGKALLAQKRWHEARSAFQDAADIVAKLHDIGTYYGDSLFPCLLGIGLCHHKLGEHSRAIDFIRRAVSTLEEGEQHGHVWLLTRHEQLGDAFALLGICSMELGDLEQAESFFRRALTEHDNGDRQGRINHGAKCTVYSALAEIHLQRQQYERAISLFDRAVQEGVQGDVLGHVNPGILSTAYLGFGRSYFHLGKTKRNLADAVRLLSSAVDFCEAAERAGTVNHRQIGDSLFLLAVCRFHQNKYAVALPLLERAIERMQRTDNPDPENLYLSHSMRAACLAHFGRHKEARKAIARANAIKR